MKRSHKRHLLTKFAVIIFALVITLIAVNATMDSTMDSTQDEEIITHISSALVYRSLDDLMVTSDLILRGSVISSSSFKIAPVFGGEPMIFTDYLIRPAAVLRGEAKNDVTVRIKGGNLDNETVISDAGPDLTKGEEYLLFLYSPNMGGGYNTEGDYYYVRGANQGAFSKAYEETYKSAVSGTELSYSKLSNDLSAINKEVPVGTYSSLNEFIANQKKNIETGFITQEEYDRGMKEIEIYAAIVK